MGKSVAPLKGNDVDWQAQEIGRSKRPLGTQENFNKLLGHYKINVRYNGVSKQIEILIPGTSYSMDNQAPASLAHILSLCVQNEYPIGLVKDYLISIADNNLYNPVLNWVTSKPWDQVSRINDLCNTIEATDNDAKSTILERWLHQTLALGIYERVDAAGILVLQGPQGLGKTWWIRRLVPQELSRELIRTDAMVNPADRDSVSQVIRYWIVELGELDATFRKSDLSALKAFLTKDQDILRRPFGSTDQVYARHTAFAASVNPMMFLYDETGNRRFWTVQCKKIDSYHKIDMQQLWAEVYYNLTELKKGWQITKAETEIVEGINQGHQQIDPIAEMIRYKFAWDNSLFLPRALTCTQIAEEMGYKNINQSVTRQIANVLRKMQIEEKRSSKTTVFMIPPLA